MVADVGVDGECADEFAGGGVDDAHVVAVDEHDDAGSVEGSAESDVVHLAVESQADSPGVDAVGADTGLAVGVVAAGAGFGSADLGNGGRGVVWERTVGSVVVVVIDEPVELGLELGDCRICGLGARPALQGLLKAFDFAAGGGVVRA